MNTKTTAAQVSRAKDAYWDNQIGEPKLSTRVMRPTDKKKIKKPKRPKGY